eukprot:sb/3469914/
MVDNDHFSRCCQANALTTVLARSGSGQCSDTVSDRADDLSLSLSFSVYLSISPSLYLPLFPCLPLPLSISLSPSLSPSLFLPLSLSFSLSLSLSLSHVFPNKLGQSFLSKRVSLPLHPSLHYFRHFYLISNNICELYDMPRPPAVTLCLHVMTSPCYIVQSNIRTGLGDIDTWCDPHPRRLCHQGLDSGNCTDNDIQGGNDLNIIIYMRQGGIATPI